MELGCKGVTFAFWYAKSPRQRLRVWPCSFICCRSPEFLVFRCSLLLRQTLRESLALPCVSLSLLSLRRFLSQPGLPVLLHRCSLCVSVLCVELICVRMYVCWSSSSSSPSSPHTKLFLSCSSLSASAPLHCAPSFAVWSRRCRCPL